MTEGVDWIRLDLVKKDEKEQRNIYKAKCLRCDKELENHRSMKCHLSNCPIVLSQQTITNFLNLCYSSKVDDINLSSEQEDLIELFVSTNISIKAIENPVVVKYFSKYAIRKSDIPSATLFRKIILAYGKKIKEKTLKYFRDKSVSLVIDGSTS